MNQLGQIFGAGLPGALIACPLVYALASRQFRFKFSGLVFAACALITDVGLGVALPIISRDATSYLYALYLPAMFAIPAAIVGAAHALGFSKPATEEDTRKSGRIVRTAGWSILALFVCVIALILYEAFGTLAGQATSAPKPAQASAPVQSPAPSEATALAQPTAKVDFATAYACVQKVVANARPTDDLSADAVALCSPALIADTTRVRRLNGMPDDPSAVARTDIDMIRAWVKQMTH
jgi:hypothetical protein